MPKAHNSPCGLPRASFEELEEEFRTILGVRPSLPRQVAEQGARLLECAGSEWLSQETQRHDALRRVAFRKLGLSKPIVRLVLDEAAAQGVYPNQIEKQRLARATEGSDAVALRSWLEGNDLQADKILAQAPNIDPVVEFRKQYHRPCVRRSDARKDVTHELRGAMVRSTFCSWIHACCVPRLADQYFNKDAGRIYFPDYFDHAK